MARQKFPPAPVVSQASVGDQTFHENAPPLCQPCYEQRHREGSFVSRLVHRPGCLLICIDCGTPYADGRQKKEAA